MDCNFKQTDRTGLYIMVFIILICVLGNVSNDKLNAKLDKLQKQLEVIQPCIQKP